MRIATIVACCLLVCAALAHRHAAPHANRHRILMHGVQRGDDHEAALTRAQLEALGDAPRHLVVHGPFTTRSQIAGLLEVPESSVDYVPHHAWLVYVRPTAVLRAVAAAAAAGTELNVYAPSSDAHLSPLYREALAVEGDAPTGASSTLSASNMDAALVAPVLVDLAVDAAPVAADWANRLSVRVTAVAARRVVLIGNPQDPARTPLTLAVWAAQQPETKFVQPHSGTARVSNLNARPVVQSGTATVLPIDAANLDGSGQIVGLGDTGVDWDNCFFVDQSTSMPFNSPLPVGDTQNRKFVVYLTLDSDSFDENGHGTHVAGTICGVLPSNRDQAELDALNPYKGLAEGVRLVVLDLSIGAEGLITVPANLTSGYLDLMYTNGARLGLSAWELPTRNFYSSAAYDIDLFAAANRDFLPIIPVGNGGGGGLSTVSAAADAKNALVVGASLSSTQASIEAIDRGAYEASWATIRNRLCVSSNASQDPLWNDPAFCEGTQRAAAPCYDPSQAALFCANFATDADDCCAFPGYLPIRCCYSFNVNRIQTSPLLFGQQLIASYSAHGPTFDGRIKPDIVATADPIVSAASNADAVVGGTVNCGLPGSAEPAITLLPTAGTSSAAAAATAAAAQVRQYFEDGLFAPLGSLVPSASLVKAVLIHGAQAVLASSGISTALASNQFYPLPDGATASSPSQYAGFGRLQLNTSLQLPSSPFVASIVDESSSRALSTGESERYCFTLSAINQPLVVTLVWTDPPASPTAEIVLVNNLDLVLIDFLGNTYRANNGGDYDALNNVERIVVPAPRAGQYQLFVAGTNIPVGPQAYSLVITSAGFATGQAPATTGSTCPAACAQDCYGVGDCIVSTGVCQCSAGRTGIDCTQSVCADNCNGRGICLGSGLCQCTSAWTGASCQAAAEGRGTTGTTGPIVIRNTKNTGISVGLFVGMIFVVLFIGLVCAVFTFFIGTGAGLLIAERLRSKRKAETLAMLEQG